MKVIEKYMADDGTLFDYEDECEAYELDQMFGKGIRMFDCDFIELSPSSFDEAYYIWCEGRDAVNTMNLLENYTGAPAPRDKQFNNDGPSCFYWDETNDEWVNFDQGIKKLADELHQKQSKLDRLIDLSMG